MDIKEYDYIFFLGIGGIGMSALARFFHINGKKVAGYDRIQTPLSIELEKTGMNIHYEDKIENIPSDFLNSEKTLIVYTPAIPLDSTELQYFQSHKFQILKRAAALGLISQNYNTIAIAGTHGKTTISTMPTYFLNHSKIKANGFIGGISKNFNSNFVLAKESNILVSEADEFDRSFLQLYPQTILISSMDADHLDIYNDKEDLQNTFKEFVSQIKDGGNLIHKLGLKLPKTKNTSTYTYDIKNKSADFYASDIQLNKNLYTFTLHTPTQNIPNLTLGVSGLVNVENAIGAAAIALLEGVNKEELQKGMQTYSGVKRRFDYHIQSEDIIYIDDYAHHPKELEAIIKSVRKIYSNKKITAIFQPHLYSRTQDFSKEFAEALSLLDELFLLDIYPARELPIKGVDSSIIFKNVKCSQKTLCSKSEILNIIKDKEFDVLLTLGAGDIDQIVPEIKKIFTK